MNINETRNYKFQYLLLNTICYPNSKNIFLSVVKCPSNTKLLILCSEYTKLANKNAKHFILFIY